MRETAGSAAAIPARCRNRRRGRFLVLLFGNLGQPAKRAAARMLHDRSGPVKENECSGYPRDQSALAPENFTTFAHFRVSSEMKVSKSADDPVSIMPPSSVSLVFTLGSARPALISLL